MVVKTPNIRREINIVTTTTRNDWKLSTAQISINREFQSLGKLANGECGEVQFIYARNAIKTGN